MVGAWLVSELISFNIFIKNPIIKSKSVVIKFADDTELEGIVNTKEDQNIMLVKLDDFEHRSNRNGMKFDRMKHEIIHQLTNKGL